MRETLKVGDSYHEWTPVRQKQPDGNMSFVANTAGENLLILQNYTVVKIIPRPQNELEAVQLAGNLSAGTTENQGFIDGKLYATDNERIGHLFNPGFFYIVES